MRYEDDDEFTNRVYKKHTRSNAEWLALIFIGVFLAILASDGVRFLVVRAWANHQLEQAAKEIQRVTEQLNQQANTQNRQRAEQARAQAERKAYDAKFNSNECVFWRDVHARNPGQKTQEGVAKHCP